MTLVEVKSSNIKKVGWDEKGLYVEYNSGMYLYEGVDLEMYSKLLLSDSKGNFVNMNIKPNYNFKRLN